MLLRLERLEAAGAHSSEPPDQAPQDPLGWEALASIEQAMGRGAGHADLGRTATPILENFVALSALCGRRNHVDWDTAGGARAALFAQCALQINFATTGRAGSRCHPAGNAGELGLVSIFATCPPIPFLGQSHVSALQPIAPAWFAVA